MVPDMSCEYQYDSARHREAAEERDALRMALQECREQLEAERQEVELKQACIVSMSERLQRAESERDTARKQYHHAANIAETLQAKVALIESERDKARDEAADWQRLAERSEAARSDKLERCRQLLEEARDGRDKARADLKARDQLLMQDTSFSQLKMLQARVARAVVLLEGCVGGAAKQALEALR